MNKYLVMTAAALAAASAAVATDAAAKGGSGSATIEFLTPGGSATYCDTITLTWNGSAAAGRHDFQTGCGYGGTSVDIGRQGKIKGEGKQWILADTFYAYYYGINWGLNYNLSAPIASGGTWTGYYTTDGVTSTEYNSGNYLTAGTASHHAPMVKKTTVGSLGSKAKVAKSKKPYGPINPF